MNFTDSQLSTIAQALALYSTHLTDELAKRRDDPRPSLQLNAEREELTAERRASWSMRDAIELHFKMQPSLSTSEKR